MGFASRSRPRRRARRGRPIASLVVAVARDIVPYRALLDEHRAVLGPADRAAFDGADLALVRRR